MRNNETGEIELVVGNRQLLSGFFIVVLLCAVAFAMGYVVGQNSPHSAKASDQSASAVPVTPTDTRPMPASPPPPTQPQPAASQPTGSGSEVGGAGAAPADTPPAPTTRPARDAEPQPAAAPPASAALPADASGNYWQVSAISNQDSIAAMQQTLKDAGFPVVLGPGPNNLTRVLVGPYSDTAAMARAKTALEKAGFHPVKK